jgi:NADH-quinone oxidoreductase subunit A
MTQYYPIVIYIVVASIISAALIGLSYLFAVKNSDAEKISPFECGFAPYGDSRQQFEIKFFLSGILFIIFDLEISFLFPWSVVFLSLESSIGYWSMIIFLFILTIGLVYEWQTGGLEWE